MSPDVSDGGSTPMVHVGVPERDAELAADLLWSCGAGAVEERVGVEAGTAVMVGDADVDRVRAALAPSWTLEVVEVHDDDWRDQWRVWARATRVGRVVVQPAWLEPMATGPADVVVVLDPGQAFGDGRHPSTRLALQALGGLVRPGASVLDAGCGSGVLAVAAKLLGAGRVLGVDHAPAAVAATRANAAVNAVEVEVGDDLAAATGRWDVVVANIGAHALVQLAPVLGPRVAAGGVLVLSGLLENQVADVVAAYAPLCVEATHVAENWAAAVLRSPPG